MTTPANSTRTTHTPGPLEANARDCGIYESRSDNKLVGTARTFADATLFAAAPDMLEALRECLAHVDFGTEERADMVRAAIRRATGVRS